MNPFNPSQIFIVNINFTRSVQLIYFILYFISLNNITKGGRESFLEHFAITVAIQIVLCRRLIRLKLQSSQRKFEILACNLVQKVALKREAWTWKALRLIFNQNDIKQGFYPKAVKITAINKNFIEEGFCTNKIITFLRRFPTRIYKFNLLMGEIVITFFVLTVLKCHYSFNQCCIIFVAVGMESGYSFNKCCIICNCKVKIVVQCTAVTVRLKSVYSFNCKLKIVVQVKL